METRLTEHLASGLSAGTMKPMLVSNGGVEAQTAAMTAVINKLMYVMERSGGGTFGPRALTTPVGVVSAATAQAQPASQSTPQQ